jgi:hypothetical protein
MGVKDMISTEPDEEKRKHYWEYGQQTKEERRYYNTGDIFENAATCGECGEYVRSNHRHDYRECSCGNVAVDGGSWYAKRVFKTNNFTNIIKYYNDVKGTEKND